jgi:hypothetical protein
MSELASRYTKLFLASALIQEKLCETCDPDFLREYKILATSASLTQKLPALQDVARFLGKLGTHQSQEIQTKKAQFLILLSSLQDHELKYEEIRPIREMLQLTSLENAIFDNKGNPEIIAAMLEYKETSVLSRLGISPLYLAIVFGRIDNYEIISKFENPGLKSHLADHMTSEKDKQLSFLTSGLGVATAWKSLLPIEAPFHTTRPVIIHLLKALNQVERSLNKEEQQIFLKYISKIGIPDPFQSDFGKELLTHIIKQCNEMRQYLNTLLTSGDYRFIEIIGEIAITSDPSARSLIYDLLTTIKIPEQHKVSQKTLDAVLLKIKTASEVKGFTGLFGK